MNIPEMLAKLSGHSDRLEKLVIDTNLLTSKLAEADARIAELEGELSARPSIDDKAKLESDLAGLSAKLAEKDAELAKLPEKINAEAARIVANAGVPPVSAVGNTTAVSTKPDHSNLTGLEKAIAAHKAKQNKLNS